MKRNKIPFGVSLGRIISSEDEDSGRRRKGGDGRVGLSLPDLNLKTSEHIFSSLESGPALPLAVVESTSVRPSVGILPSFPFPLPPPFLSLRHFFALTILLSRFLLPVRRVLPEIKARRRQQLGPWGVIRDEGWEPAVAAGTVRSQEGRAR